MTLESLQTYLYEPVNPDTWETGSSTDVLVRDMTETEPLVVGPTPEEMKSAEHEFAMILFPDAATESADDNRFMPDRYEEFTGISAYFRDIDTRPLLTFEEERKLFGRIEKGRSAREKLLKNPDIRDDSVRAEISDGVAAYDEIILRNTRLVIAIAKKYQGAGVDFIDLIAEGNIGLMRAVKRFDCTRETRFGTYATWWIRLAVSDAIDYQGRTMRLPRLMLADIRKLNAVRHRLTQKLHREPTADDYIPEMNMDRGRIVTIIMNSRKLVYLDAPSDEEDSGSDSVSNFLDRHAVIYENGLPPEEEAVDSALRRDIAKALAKMPEREAKVLMLLTGMWDGTAYSLEAAGKIINGPDGKVISKERVRQIRDQAISRLDARTLENLREYYT